MDAKMAVIEPNKCIVEDWEILAFENEEQLNFYTIWHEALVDKRRELNAVSDRERQIIRNEIARKTRQLISLVGGSGDDVKVSKKASISTPSATNSSRRSSGSKAKGSTLARRSPAKSATPSVHPGDGSIASPTATTTSATTIGSSPRKAPASSNGALAASRRAIAAAVAFRPSTSSTSRAPNHQSGTNAQPVLGSHQRQPASANLPNGLTILNSAYYNTLPSGKQMMKYKLTKLYNKYRGRQVRRNLVNDKQRNSRIEVEINKSYLNSWLAYTALQALRLPETNINSLNATTINSSQILTPFAGHPNNQAAYYSPNPMAMSMAMPMPMAMPLPMSVPMPMQPPMTMPTSAPSPAPAFSSATKTTKTTSKKTKSPSKKQQQQKQQEQPPQQPTIANQQIPQYQQKPPLHLVYIDPGNIITYSNRINPQQVAEYKQKSHLLPSSATSKKSSAASYDVYEIMEVLANTTKTNVTITRNANRPASSQNSTSSGSIYSHSVNANTPGIVSTQLHLQARSYLDIMTKFYADESKRLEEERESMKREPSDEVIVRKYLNIDDHLQMNNNSNNFETRSQGSLNSNANCSSTDSDQLARSHSDQEEDELEMLEDDIKSMLKVGS